MGRSAAGFDTGRHRPHAKRNPIKSEGLMFGAEQAGTGVDTVAHIIQAALTPVFLLSGIATLLNVFSTRLARVADQVEVASRALASADVGESRLLSRRLTRLHLRSLALDAAVILAATGGAATCAAVLALFISSLREMSNSWPVRTGRRFGAGRRAGLHGRNADRRDRHPRRGRANPTRRNAANTGRGRRCGEGVRRRGEGRCPWSIVYASGSLRQRQFTPAAVYA